MKKIIIVLYILLALSFGCVDNSEEAAEIRETIELKISELANSNEILLLEECKNEFDTLLEEPFPLFEDINAKYNECDNLVNPIIDNTTELIEFIESNQWELSRKFDLELDNYIDEVEYFSIDASKIKTTLKIRLANFKFTKTKNECLKEETAFSCTSCCQENFNIEKLNYYNECKLECIILE
jgi:hypothetical protein